MGGAQSAKKGSLSVSVDKRCERVSFVKRLTSYRGDS